MFFSILKEKANDSAEVAGVEPPDLEPLVTNAIPIDELTRKADGTTAKKTQRNFTDPDSHLKPSSGTYLQAYNYQLAVDSDHQVIVAIGVSNQSPVFEHLEPILEHIIASAGALEDMVKLDKGNWSENNVIACEKQSIDIYIASARAGVAQHGQKLPPARVPLPGDANIETESKLWGARRERGSTAAQKQMLNR